MMMELRWLLIIIGIVIIVAVFAYSRNQRQEKDGDEFSRTSPSRDLLADEEKAEEKAKEKGEEKAEEKDIPSLHIKTSDTKADDEALHETIKLISVKTAPPETDSPETDPPPQTPATHKPTLVVLHVWARLGRYWRGERLIEVATKADLTATDKNIFQFFHQNNSTTPLFHVANKTEPGTFEWDKMKQFKTQGVSLFMELPVFCSADEAFLLMHACAQRFADLLDGEILDCHHKPIEQQTIDEIHQMCRTMDGET